MHVLDVVTWAVQIALGLFFIGGGIPKLTGRGLERWTGFSDLPRSVTLLIGISDLLGSLGLILPMATGIAPWLTPLAATGLAVTMFMAAGFHLRAGESINVLETLLFAALAVLVAIARSYPVRPYVLVALMVVLVPAAIINLVVLLTRPPNARGVMTGHGPRTGGAGGAPLAGRV